MKLQKKRNSSNTGMPASANVRPVVHAVDWPTVTLALASATTNCGFATEAYFGYLFCIISQLLIFFKISVHCGHTNQTAARDDTPHYIIILMYHGHGDLYS